MSENMWRTLCLILGLFFIVMGRVIMEKGYFPTATDAIGYGFWGVGIFSWLYGCYLWAKLKGRHWANMFWGCLWFIGLVVLYMMEDKSGKVKVSGHVKRQRGGA